MKTVKCIITGQNVKRCFKYKGCYYAFCCLGCIGPLINKICKKDPKVKTIKLKSCKDLEVVKLNVEQKKKLQMSMKKSSTKKSTKKKTKKKSTKRKSTRRK
tara:strand:- start:1727 stop:2029 length:303 start_codon:yes stop_codon:yes gene_type:complete